MPRQLGGTANVPIHLGMCTAGSMRQNGIWGCPYLRKAHLQKGCPDLIMSGGDLTSIRIFDVSAEFTEWDIYRFLHSATDLRKDDLCCMVIINPSHVWTWKWKHWQLG